MVLADGMELIPVLLLFCVVLCPAPVVYVLDPAREIEFASLQNRCKLCPAFHPLMDYDLRILLNLLRYLICT